MSTVLGSTARTEDWDQGRVWLAAEHEAAHAAAAHHFGWHTDEIQLREEYLRRRWDYEAIQLVAKLVFRDAAARVSAALVENGGHLEGRELKLVLARPMRLRPRAAWPPPEEWTDEMLDEHEHHVKDHFPEQWEAWLARCEAAADRERLVNRNRQLQLTESWAYV